MVNQKVDKIQKNTKKYKENNSKREVFLLDENTPFAITEAYKTARTNIIFSLSGHKGKSIAITSCWSFEGKTTTSVNLAITFAQNGGKVLLIDADLRKPRISTIFGISNDNGVSNVLIGLCDINDAIHKNCYENLDVLTSGHIPPNPAELLSSNKMQEMMAQLYGVYDYILIDTPPINLITDASVVSNFASGTVIVVREDLSDYKSIETALEKLEFSSANLLGFVMNDVDSGNHGAHRYSRKYRKYDYNKYVYRNELDEL